MTNVIFLLGLFVAALFGIAMYGLGGVDPADGITWVEYGVFGIIGISALPAAKELIEMYIEAFRNWRNRQKKSAFPTNRYVSARINGADTND